ncbi:MAG: hypothetical protein QOJ25_2257 [Solirubrobacteraceae bacterium]|jgi:hypothetical protein|nr:hypothetical protein [Solirubrobacteraceae bacterium]
MKALTYFGLEPISELGIWGWRLERRTEFLWREQFDRYLLPPAFAAVQALQNARRRDEGLAIAEERELPDEERCIQEIIDEIAAFMKENWLPGGVQRFGNTKTFGVVRGEFHVLPGLPDNLRHGVLAHERTYPAWVRFSGPGPYAPPDLYDYGQCSVGIKLMDVPGPKLLDDERSTQDLILVSPASFVTPNVQENAKLQRYVRSRSNLFYFLNPADSHVLAAVTQALFSRMHTSPLETRYYSNVPFLLGDGQAVEYSLRPRSSKRTKIPMRAADNYLREAMARTLASGDWVIDFMVQVQTDPHRMPIEDATVKWPEHLSPYVPVAELRLPRQRFDSPEQLAFADNLSFNPWHSLAAHRPLGNQNRARRRMYQELARLRQSMNQAPHIEPTGAEQFPDAASDADGRAGNGRARRRPVRPGRAG